VRDTSEDTPEHAARLAILFKTVSHFTATLLSDIDIHSLVASYEHETRKFATPSLLAEAFSGRTSIFALFGGQGINEIYFDELQMLFDTYRPFVEPFLTSAVDEVLQPSSSASQGTSFYEHGMNVMSWLTGVAPLPPIAYLASVPVSFPLIGLTDPVHPILGRGSRVWSITCGAAQFSGASGDSQGLVTVHSPPVVRPALSSLQYPLNIAVPQGQAGRSTFGTRRTRTCAHA
jgi:hypothetical protein